MKPNTEMNTTDTRFINCFIDKNNPKFELNGANFDKENAVVVATDTRAIIAFKYECKINGIVPKRVFDLVAKTQVKTKPLLVDFHIQDGKEFDYSQEVFQMRAGDLILGMPAINGKFPDWQRIMPPSYREQYDCIEDDKERFFNKDAKTPIPKLQIREAHAHTIAFECARLGSMVDDKYIKPIIDWLDLVEKENREVSYKVEILYREPTLPIRIEHESWTITIMPIVY